MTMAQFAPHDDALVLAYQRFLEPVIIMVVEWLECLPRENVFVVEAFE